MTEADSWCGRAGTTLKKHFVGQVGGVWWVCKGTPGGYSGASSKVDGGCQN